MKSLCQLAERFITSFQVQPAVDRYMPWTGYFWQGSFKMYFSHNVSMHTVLMVSARTTLRGSGNSQQKTKKTPLLYHCAWRSRDTSWSRFPSRPHIPLKYEQTCSVKHFGCKELIKYLSHFLRRVFHLLSVLVSQVLRVDQVDLSHPAATDQFKGLIISFRDAGVFSATSESDTRKCHDGERCQSVLYFCTIPSYAISIVYTMHSDCALFLVVGTPLGRVPYNYGNWNRLPHHPSLGVL